MQKVYKVPGCAVVHKAECMALLKLLHCGKDPERYFLCMYAFCVRMRYVSLYMHSPADHSKFLVSTFLLKITQHHYLLVSHRA